MKKLRRYEVTLPAQEHETLVEDCELFHQSLLALQEAQASGDGRAQLYQMELIGVPKL